MSFNRAVDVLAASLLITPERPGHMTRAGAHRTATRLMRDALSDKQRAKLDARG